MFSITHCCYVPNNFSNLQKIETDENAKKVEETETTGDELEEAALRIEKSAQNKPDGESCFHVCSLYSGKVN